MGLGSKLCMLAAKSAGTAAGDAIGRGVVHIACSKLGVEPVQHAAGTPAEPEGVVRSAQVAQDMVESPTIKPPSA